MGKMINFRHVNSVADFPAILNHYGLEFTQKGSQIRLCCPFHDDKKPSLSVTLEATDGAQANTFHCFGCGEKGSVLDFVGLMEGDDDLRAVAETVASITGCSLAPAKTRSRRTAPAKAKGSSQRRGEAPAGRSQAKPKGEPKKTATGDPGGAEELPEANQPLKFTFDLDCEHESVLARLDAEAAEYFGVGWLSDERRSMMAGRICIPIHNIEGDLVAYVGRWADEHDIPDDEDKYKFPPRFNKAAELFNLHRVDDPSEIVLVEGFFGAMRLHQLGVPVVALMGTAISDKQIALLGRVAEHVWVMLDNDAPGVKARKSIVDDLARSFFVRTVSLPEGGSPDNVPEAELQRALGPRWRLRNQF